LIAFGAITATLALMLFWRDPSPATAASDFIIYDDSLAANWWNGSWGTTLNFNNATPHQSGSASTSAAYTSAWGGVYFGTSSALAASNYTSIRFWIHGGTGGQRIAFKLIDAGGTTWNNFLPITPTANVWTPYTVTLSSLGITNTLGGVVWQENSGATPPTFYLDNIVLLAAPALPPPTLALTVDVSANRHAISPYIYGMNFADESLAQELHLPVRRYGGNATTRYNYLLDTANRASDWYFENIPNPNSNPGLLPNGSESDQFVDQDRRTDTKTLMTLPLIGWTPKDRVYRCGFSVSAYGAQQFVDSPYHSDCGNGVRTNGTNVTGNNPLDTSIAITESFDASWVQHFIARYNTAANGGVMFYNLDNEPMLWNSSHRDVHPSPTSYDELRDKTYQYAPAIKAADPTAKILGPAEWGWDGYFYSALDFTNGLTDRASHGGMPFAAWYLQQMQAYQTAHGTRVLDYFDLHYYPQANGVTLCHPCDPGTNALRLRSTRSLWDPTYADESWINGTKDGPYVRLIPRMRDWVNTNYPGTKIALGEYNWGALDAINGALTEADILGIFGRESLDLAALWDPPTSTQPGAFAFRMYRNYDGAGKTFGDVSVRAMNTITDSIAIHAAQRSTDNALTLIVINKMTNALTTTVTLSNFIASPSAQVYRYSVANLNAIVAQPNQAVSASGFTATFPASSITLFVIAPLNPLTPKVYLPMLIR